MTLILSSDATQIVANTAIVIIIALFLTPLFLAFWLYMTGRLLGEDEDSKYWRWGFYFNKDDKRIIVPKKYGWGWTLNYANPYAKILGLIFMAAPIYIIYHLIINHFKH